MSTNHDVAPDARHNKRLEKEMTARRIECLDEKRTHLRAGTWSGRPIDAVALVGHCRDLHGTVCTCCPRREVASR